MEAIVGGDWFNWRITADENNISLFCPSCPLIIDMEQNGTFTLDEILEVIRTHQEEV